jgi:citrate synthase
VADQRESGDDIHMVAVRNIERWREHTKAVPGFGHPQHSEGDPRANLLLRLADERGVSGEHVAMMRALQAALPEMIGSELPVNVNGPIPAIMLDLGFPLAALKGIGLLCRTAGLVAHLTEEAERPIGFILSGAAAKAIEYDGEART